ncbi:enoyl-CoA hydratase/isomerase family protein [Acidovorax sp. NCPPB 4044]|uniref:enoyl-CoA hydratase/isomerase family protein n=1 Tax=Acidovorax sp. NCPPB 4044 TaxID=2940490 RepID=UPI002302D2DA|nr:enoyl-CoA hydratase/isomerase family protein [Acidovorax sp. NCPPB 4044]MDA8520048.1 enoyl-CoA hydratase/isomerase family protein [Acidovorax sp. NCPPB 4044]
MAGGEIGVAWPEGGGGGIVRVTLRHPGRLNAMSRGMWRDLRAVFQRIHASPAARCVLVAGEGEAFCAGGDISEYPGFRFDPASLRDFHENDVWGGLSAMLDCDVPIVAAIRGACMGAGVEIAACCDVRFAAASARFGAPIARLGFPMAPREAALIAQAVGDALARRMLLEAATVGAEVLAAQGFLAQAVPDDQLADAAAASAARIAALAPQAARLNKQTLRACQRIPVPLGSHAAESIEKFAMNNVAIRAAPGFDPYGYASSAEHREGIAAFLEKRPPRF